MKQATYDPCLLYSNKPFRVVRLQTDDTLFVEDLTFATLKQTKLEKAQFLAKDHNVLKVNNPIKFNRGLIQLEKNSNITLPRENSTRTTPQSA